MDALKLLCQKFGDDITMKYELDKCVWTKFKRGKLVIWTCTKNDV